MSGPYWQNAQGSTGGPPEAVVVDTGAVMQQIKEQPREDWPVHTVAPRLHDALVRSLDDDDQIGGHPGGEPVRRMGPGDSDNTSAVLDAARKPGQTRDKE